VASSAITAIANIVYSVIFVHGLGSFPDSTWRKKDTSDLDPEERDKAWHVSWIRDFLTDDLRSARLLFYNYDSTTYNDAQQLMLRDFGRELLDVLEDSDLRTSPIVLFSYPTTVSGFLSEHRLGARTTNHLLMSQLRWTCCKASASN
jgi:hypothetical protein